MTAPAKVLELVERFRRNLDVYTRPDYKETQARVEFIDPFFEALGWDVRNVQAYAEQYKDVIHEDAIKVGGATRAPDYCFRIGGVRKFFLEAKKPSVAIKGDVSPAYQLRRYAWSAKLSLSILTDFEEFAVYDCRIRPKSGDKAGVGRVMYYTFDQYPAHWADIHDVFARESVLRGSFDRYVSDTRAKRGTSEVDAEFLQEIEGWREALARNLALRNPALSVYELNFAVQRTIDRLIFLRMAEDRGIEAYGRLLALTADPHIYQRLADDLYRQADEKYNSSLFDFRADTLTRSLGLDDKVIKPILTGLYYPDCPYEFSVLPAEVLGQVYEQFLGKVIRLTPGHRAVVEEKPEVKKAGGVYYTPAYIVDYIVQQTVGKLVEGQSPRQLRGTRGRPPLRVLDPACGSGSFLLGAYQYLLAHYRRWYEANDPQKHAAAKEPPVYQGPGGAWRLTTAKKKRILLDHIYGVDIDRQAVEVTKLSLLLQVLEGETDETLGQQLSLWRERALPDLDSNIKCGNSLIGPDYFAAQLMPDEDELRRVNPFDWRREFPEVFPPGRGAGGEGGFDAVIGNPPYLRIQGLQEFYGNQIDYFAKHYRSAVKRFDLYLLFAEKGFSLLAEAGYLGFICPHKFLNSDFGSGLREFLIDNSALHSFVSFGNNPVFSQASTYTGILLLRKNRDSAFSYYEYADMPVTELPSRLAELAQADFTTYDLEDLTKEPWVLTNRDAQLVLNRLATHPRTLGDAAAEILVGVQSGIDSIHVLRVVSESAEGVVTAFSERANANIDIEVGLVKPFLRGEDVQRYARPQYSHFCIYPYQLVDGTTKILEESELKERFPRGYSYLREYRSELTKIRERQRTNPKYWYSCHRSRSMAVFESERIITPEISLGCNMTVSPPGIYHNTKVYSLLPSPAQPERRNYWLGLLNSKVLWWFLTNTGYVLRGGYFTFKTNYLKPFPIRTINFHDDADVARHDRLVALVEGMLDLHKKLAAAAIPAERTLYQRQIEAADRQIDALVYELYGLSEKEMAIVEASR